MLSLEATPGCLWNNRVISDALGDDVFGSYRFGLSVGAGKSSVCVEGRNAWRKTDERVSADQGEPRRARAHRLCCAAGTWARSWEVRGFAQRDPAPRAFRADTAPRHPSVPGPACSQQGPALQQLFSTLHMHSFHQDFTPLKKEKTATKKKHKADGAWPRLSTRFRCFCWASPHLVSAPESF